MTRFFQLALAFLLLTASITVGVCGIQACRALGKISAAADAVTVAAKQAHTTLADLDKAAGSATEAAQDATVTLQTADSTLKALTAKGALRKAIF